VVSDFIGWEHALTVIRHRHGDPVTGVLVHEWLARAGGSENVFESLTKAFPDAPLYCLWDDSDGRFAVDGETWLARTPLRGRKAAAVPFMPAAWRRMPAVDADWVLASSHLFSHHVRFRGSARDAPKLVYAHTPARYIWTPELDGRGSSGTARAAAALLKPVDRRRAQEATAIAANSRFVADRIAEVWQRESEVIYPPVDVVGFGATPSVSASEQALLDRLPADYLLGFSRFIPYKRLELVIAAGAATGMPVVLAGAGPEEARLRAAAEELHPGRVSFVVAPGHDMHRALLRGARTLVFPAVEDFGIVPVEAMAAGTPVVANAVGGTAESILHGTTGALVRDWTPGELRAGVETALATSPEQCRRRAADFSEALFVDRIRGWVSQSIGEAAGGSATRVGEPS